MSNQELSLVDIAVSILKEAKQPLNIYELFNKASQLKEISEEEKADEIAQFYADITISAKFVYVGENEWDLKDNQKTDLWEKDGSYYKEYNEVKIPEEYLEKEAKVLSKEETVQEVVEVVATEVEPLPVETTEVPDLVEESPVVEDVISDDFDDELFEDDFDEEKYNEYMDTYEDQYED